MDGGDLDHRDRGFGVGRFLRIPDINYITEWTKRFQQYFLLMESMCPKIEHTRKYYWYREKIFSSKIRNDSGLISISKSD